MSVQTIYFNILVKLWLLFQLFFFRCLSIHRMSHIIAIVLHEYLKEKLIIRGTMAKLALNLCKWIFSFLGLLPLRLKFDESSGKFKGFVFSFFYPETWWYFVVLAVQVICTASFSVGLRYEMNERLAALGRDSAMLSILQVNTPL